MRERKRMAEFDYKAAERDAEARLRESPPVASIWHLEGDTWDEFCLLPTEVVGGMKSLFVMCDRDAASIDATSGQLKHEIGEVISKAFAAGHDAGWREQLEYIRAVRDGREEPAWRFADGDEILDWLLGDLETHEPSQEGDDVTLAEILADLRARGV
ncbi:MAG: hypothetical protein M3P18_15100 [Actinomycetota bacterium]|nr:hypothetical protein [Actinomycetota bacterium]